MHPFALLRADDLTQAIAVHAADTQLVFIAGGTDLIGLIKDRAASPQRLLDINGLPGMAKIDALPQGGLRIGALSRMSDVAADMEVRRQFPANAEALLFSASGQLRNMASIGGNIMQRTRCAYFRDETGGRCNKRGSQVGCAALHGLNRNHAIFGWSESCVATNPSDLAVALAAMDAIVIVNGQAGERRIPLADFHRLPGSTPERDNVLERGDLIVAVEVPASVDARASHYLKVRDRASYEFALVSAFGCGRQWMAERIRSARIAMGGGVAGRLRDSAAAESSLQRNFARRHRLHARGQRRLHHPVADARPLVSQRFQSRVGAACRWCARCKPQVSAHMNAVGQNPISRVDGLILQVLTGGARYTADIARHLKKAPLFTRQFVYSTIANGRTVSTRYGCR